MGLVKEEYIQGVQDLESGLLEKVSAQVRQWRQLPLTTAPSADQDLLRMLLSVRLALKGGQVQENLIALLLPLQSADPFVMAEIEFVRGLSYFQTERPSEGSEAFDRASVHYLAIGKNEKYLLSKYNCYAGQVNAGKLDTLARHEFLNQLEKEALAYKAEKILAWVLREKSYLMQAEGRFAAALDFIREAQRIFRVLGPLSDFHLSLAQAADCCLDLGQVLEATAEVEKISGHIDSRVEFARDMILERLGSKTLNLQNYPVRSPYWENKWRLRQSPPATSTGHWNSQSGELRIGDKVYLIKAASQEGKLLRLLAQSRRSKAMLTEMFWPEHADPLNLDNRFHRLIHRFNRKCDLIGFQDGFYSLKHSIQIS